VSADQPFDIARLIRTLEGIETDVDLLQQSVAVSTQLQVERAPASRRGAELLLREGQRAEERHEAWKSLLASLAELVKSGPVKVGAGFAVFFFGAVLLARVGGIHVEDVNLAELWPGVCP
jgi:hypothetical protein